MKNFLSLLKQKLHWKERAQSLEDKIFKSIEILGSQDREIKVWQMSGKIVDIFEKK